MLKKSHYKLKTVNINMILVFNFSLYTHTLTQGIRYYRNHCQSMLFAHPLIISLTAFLPISIFKSNLLNYEVCVLPVSGSHCETAVEGVEVNLTVN